MKTTIQRRQALTLSRHVEIGRTLHSTIEMLYALRRELESVPRDRFAREASTETLRAIRRLDELRNSMENLLFTSPCIDAAKINPCNVYYGPFDRVAE